MTGSSHLIGGEVTVSRMLKSDCGRDRSYLLKLSFCKIGFEDIQTRPVFAFNGHEPFEARNAVSFFIEDTC